MVRDVSTGAVAYNCTVCGETAAGGDDDTLILTLTLGDDETTDMYTRLIEVAPFDQTNQIVDRQCQNCGLDYMTLIRVGDQEKIVFACSCGAKVIGGK
jgi:hypothetical protein